MKRRFGDRKDARKIGKLDGMHIIMFNLKPKRCDSDVYINQKIDVTELIKYIEKKKKENKNTDEKITFFHAFSMAFAKTVYNRPKLNMFVANNTLYERNDIVIAFVAKIALNDSSEEIMLNIKVDENDNISDLSKKIKQRVDKVRASSETDKKEKTNNIVDILGKLPKPIRTFIVGLAKWLDKHGWLPSFVTEDNIYYSSIILSNLGTLKIGSIYHNLTDFGTSSILATMGQIHKEVVVDEKGNQKIIDVCDFGINCDERIADGYYFAKSIEMFEYILKHPEMLEEKANEKIEIE